MPPRKDYIIHTPEEIVRIRRAAALTAGVRDELARLTRPGMSTLELDELAGSLIAQTGGRSAFLGYHGFPGNICISVNDVVVHGIGRADLILSEQDIVSIDIGVEIDGACGDTALTFALNDKPPADTVRLLENTRAALMSGIRAAVSGNCIRDISRAVAQVARHARLGVVEDYVGHGCGIRLHEPPEVPNFDNGYRGPRLVPGMVLAIEPMFNLGSRRVYTEPDQWTVRTADRSLSAHFEHQVLITEQEPEILTWPKTM